MPPQITAQPFFAPQSEALRFLPECPRLLSGRDHLGWVAIQHSATAREGSFNILNIVTRRNVQFDLDGRPGFFAEGDDPALIVIGIERRLDVFDMMRGKIVRTIAQIASKEDVIINDGLHVPGGLIFGTKHLGFSEPVAALYFFNSNNGSVHMLASGQYCSNGKYFTTENKDEPVLYDIDSTPKKLTRYRLTKDLEGVLDQQIVFGSERFPAVPDGLRPTPDGTHRNRVLQSRTCPRWPRPNDFS